MKKGTADSQFLFYFLRLVYNLTEAGLYQFGSQDTGLVSFVQDRVDFYHIHGQQLSGFGQSFHQQERFTNGQTGVYDGTGSGSSFRM